jgi:lipoteichoic acid synthase
MHQPYNRLLDSSFEINDSSIDEELKFYLNACHYTDEAIRNYLVSLKNKGLYNNSIIVIASDHHVHSTDFGGGISTDIPLFIINGDFNGSYAGACNQLDVYTTIVDMMNVPNPWPGLGYSLLNPKYNNIDLNKRWDVSEWLLLSNFFDSSRMCYW